MATSLITRELGHYRSTTVLEIDDSIECYAIVDSNVLSSLSSLNIRLITRRKYSLIRRMGVEAPFDVERIFAVVGALLPPRIANEELGDAMEQIHRMYTLGCPRWQLTLRMWTAIFWAAFHTVTDTLSRVLNRV